MSDQHREVIDRFTGPYAFLSNFHPCRVTFYGMAFPSVEAAFQAAKCADHRDRAQFLAMTPEQAKRRGRQIRMRDDWDARKRTIMHNLLVHKFSENPDLIPKLLATGGAVLVEGNTWHDNYWGCCTCSRRSAAVTGSASPGSVDFRCARPRAASSARCSACSCLRPIVSIKSSCSLLACLRFACRNLGSPLCSGGAPRLGLVPR